MSLLGSISGFLSSIAATPIVTRNPLTDHLSRSVLPRTPPPHPTPPPSDASPTTSVRSQPEVLSSITGSRRTSSSSSSCWSSRSSLVREGSSTDPAPADVDLSHLTDEERVQIEAVMERARLIQEFDAYDLVTSSSAVDIDPDSCAEEAEDVLQMRSEGGTSERPGDTCAICRLPGVAFVRVCDECCQPMEVCLTCNRSTPGDDAIPSMKADEPFLCPKCSATKVSSCSLNNEVSSAKSKTSDARTELEAKQNVDEYEDQRTSRGVWAAPQSERSESMEDHYSSSPYSSSSSSSSSSTDSSFDVPTPDGPDPKPLVLFSPEETFSRSPEMDGTTSFPTENSTGSTDRMVINGGGTSWWCSNLEDQVDLDFICDRSAAAPRASSDDLGVGPEDVDEAAHGFGIESTTDEGHAFSTSSSTSMHLPFHESTDREVQSASAHHGNGYSWDAITFSPPFPGSPNGEVEEEEKEEKEEEREENEEEEEADLEEGITVPCNISSSIGGTEMSVTDRTRDVHQSNEILEVNDASLFLSSPDASEILQDLGFESQRSNEEFSSYSSSSAPTKTTTTNVGNPFLTSANVLRIDDEIFSLEIYETLFDERSSSVDPEETASKERSLSILPDAADSVPSDVTARNEVGSLLDSSAPPQFQLPDNYWDQSEEIREIFRMPYESLSMEVHGGNCQTKTDTQESGDGTSFGIATWSLSPPESSSVQMEDNHFVFEYPQPEVTEPQIEYSSSSSVKNSDGRTNSCDAMIVSEQPEAENLSSSRSLNAIGTSDTSPTLGMFKRCPSYSNILALPSLSNSGHLSNPLLSTTTSSSTPTPRRYSEGSTPQNTATLDLVHLEGEQTMDSRSNEKQESQRFLLEEKESSDDSAFDSPSRKPSSGPETAIGEVRFTLGDAQLQLNMTDIVRKISPVAGAESTILWLDSSPVGLTHDVPDQCSSATKDPWAKDPWTCIPPQAPDDPNLDSQRDIHNVYEAPNSTERNENEYPTATKTSSPVNDAKNKTISSAVDQSSETQSETSRSSGGFAEERRASLTPPSDALTVIGAEEQIFLSDEELREIDLDEDIPPKHLLVRRTSRPKLPFCSAKSAPTFGQRVFDGGLVDQWEPRWEELGSVAFGKLEGERMKDESEFRDQAGSLDDLQQHRQVRRRLPAIPVSSSEQWNNNSSSNNSSTAGAAGAGGRPLRLAEVKKIRPMLKARSLSADATHHQPGATASLASSLSSSSRQRPNPKCLTFSRSLSVEDRTRAAEDEDTTTVSGPFFYQDPRSGRSPPQPVVGDARHRRSSSTKTRSKSAEVTPPPRPRGSSVLPPRSFSADDRRANDLLTLLTGSGFTSGSYRSAVDSNGMGGSTTTDEFKRGRWRTTMEEEEEICGKTEIEARSSSPVVMSTSEDGSDRDASRSARINTSEGGSGVSDASTNRTDCPLVSANYTNVPVAKIRQKVPPKIPPKPRRLLKKDVVRDAQEEEEEKAPPPFVSVFGLSVPTSVHSWMLRVKDEVKIVTATKRLRLDEAEEVRIMEAELAVRTKERRRTALKVEQEEREKRRAKAAEEKASSLALCDSAISDAMFIQKMNFDSDVHTKHFLNEDDLHHQYHHHGRAWTTTPTDQPFRMEDTSSTTSRFLVHHKRQASDPTFSADLPYLRKNPDRGSFPTDFETLPRCFDRSKATASERAAPQPIHLGITVLTQRKTDVSPPQVVDNTGSQPILLQAEKSSYPQARSASAGRLASASTGSLPMMMLGKSNEHRMEFYARECEALRKKKEKIDRLQREIDRRRQHLAETLRQCERLRTDAYRLTNEEDPLPPDHHPIDVSSTISTLPPSDDDDPELKGLIRPIDYPIDPEKYYVKFEPPTPPPPPPQPPPRDSAPNHPDGQDPFDSSVYSSFEYIVHKSEHAQNRRRPDSAFRGVSSSSSPAWSSLPHSGQQTRRRRQDTIDSHTLSSDTAPYSESDDPNYYYYSHGTYGSSSHDSGVSSTLTGTDTLPYREQTPPPAPPARPPPRVVGGGDRRRGGTRPDHGAPSYVPASGTPPMPILDDVANRSRSVLRGMGSRPLSDDMGKYFQSEEPLQLMYKEGSDGSVAESMDESSMEGGTALRRNFDRRQFRAVISSLHKYSFPTKRILLTSDSKDRTFKGFGIKIRGGQVLPWMGDDVGAYVAYIYPGSSADQLHGELQEGDQVLEINGEPLGGKTELELRQILARCNCEMELVVRHGVNMRSYPSNTMSTLSTLQTDSNRSSYDNIPTVSSCDGIDSFEGVDRELTQLSLDVLDSVLDRKSMLLTSGVVRTLNDDDVNDRRTPSLLPTGNDDSVGSMGSRSRRQFDAKRCVTSPSNRDNGFLGEIQLQLSYDDYDCTLNIHVIQARYLQPVKFKSGYADPFVKVYLLPYKSRTESKRKAKCIPRTLNPEWHRTMVFVDLHPSELPLKTLDVSVWDHDHLLPDQLMGHISLDLSDLSILDNRPHWYQLIDEHAQRTSSGNNGVNNRGGHPSLVATNIGGVITPSDSSSSSNLSKPSTTNRSRNPDRKSPWSNQDRATPKPPAVPPTRPSPRNTPDGWMNGGTADQVGMLRGLQPEETIPDMNSINRDAYLLGKTPETDGRRSQQQHQQQQQVITHQRNSVYPITGTMENPAQWTIVDPNRRHNPDVRIETQCEIKFETKPKPATCFDCLLLFFCCSRSSRGVAPGTVL